MDSRTAVPPVLYKTKSKRHFWPQRHHEFKELMLTKLASLKPLTKNAPWVYWALRSNETYEVCAHRACGALCPMGNKSRKRLLLFGVGLLHKRVHQHAHHCDRRALRASPCDGACVHCVRVRACGRQLYASARCMPICASCPASALSLHSSRFMVDDPECMVVG